VGCHEHSPQAVQTDERWGVRAWWFLSAYALIQVWHVDWPERISSSNPAEVEMIMEEFLYGMSKTTNTNLGGAD